VCVYIPEKKKGFSSSISTCYLYEQEEEKVERRISFFWGPAETLEAHCSSWGFVSPSGGK
jgi:hypothetical protein